MVNKMIIPYINAENDPKVKIIQLATTYCYTGADELFLYNYTKDEKSKEEFLAIIKEMAKQIDIPFLIGITIERLEDLKKALYTGASKAVVKYENLKEDIIKEAIARFGAEKFIIEFDTKGNFNNYSCLELWKEMGIEHVLLKHVVVSKSFEESIKKVGMSIWIRDSLIRNDLATLCGLEEVLGVLTNYFEHKDLMKGKLGLKEQGIKVNTYESILSFCDFKTSEQGLVPVVAQDYKTKEVLMLAYMNQEAFEQTILTGKMTYWSRSRQKIWCKGETSGHYQYVKNLSIDCDRDTILAKVHQVGVACHTGNQTCFYQELVKKEYDDTNPLTIFNQVFSTILDRRQNKKEGSYTNYLFEKGIDKILKKCGEEAAEIIIAAKNPNAEELRYEIADFLYHLMVLMAECNLDWNDITKELAHRR